MKKYNRIFTIVLDSLGVGAMPDAAEYGDAGCDTLGHIAARTENFKIPNLQKLGMANLHELPGVDPAILDPRDTYADASEWETKAKDLASRFIKNFKKYESNELGKALVAAGPQE